MQYRRLGHTGLIVSRFALGAWTFGAGPGTLPAVQKVNRQEDADNLVARALDAGINFFNAADTYAGAEEMLGRALKRRRNDVAIATKVGLRAVSADRAAVDGTSILNAGLSRRHILNSIEGSLKRLGTDHVDLYLAHVPDRYTPLDETIEAFDSLVRKGLARYVGFSNWPAWMAAKAVEMQRASGLARFAAAEMYYSLVCRDLEAEFMPFADSSGVGVIAWSPLAGGYLTGKYAGGDGAGNGGRLSGFDLTPADPVKGPRALAALRRVAGRRNASPAQIALAWMCAQPSVTSIILGASRLAQLEENLGAASIQLTPEEISELDEAAKPDAPYPHDILKRVWALDDVVERAFRA